MIALLHLVLKFDPGAVLASAKVRPRVLCACCGAPMIILQTQIGSWLPASSTTAIPAPIPITAITSEAL
ncbi:MAG: hypothetical protein SGI99_13165 [Pseudomonadota bacterium]|nr:hypothetical protein [Pseudomonadota bacterium]